MEIIQDAGKIIVFLLVLLAFFLFTVKSKRQLPNRLLGAFWLVTAVDLSGLFLPAISSELLTVLRMASVLLQMPLYLLFVQSACYYNFRLKWVHGLHALLFVGFAILLQGVSLAEWSYTGYAYISKIQYYAYMIVVLLVLRKYKKAYEANYSSNHYHTYKWLFQTTVLFLVGNCFVMLRSVVTLDGASEWLSGIQLVISVYALFVVCWFMLKVLYNPQLLQGIDQELVPVVSAEAVDLPMQKELEVLTKYMEVEQPYLDPELTLQKLADGVAMPEKEISQLINRQVGQHFFDFVNGYRVNHAKKLLKENKSLTVLEILYKIGFNSKSSFYTAFKKETGMTPSMYRKSVD